MNRLTCSVYSTFLAGILLVTPGCSDRKASDTSDASARYSAGQSIRIVFHLSGDDIGSKADRTTLGSIIDAFIRDGIGEVVRTEFGMGSMEVTIRARAELSSESIDRIILAEYPKARYRKEELKE